MESEKLNIFIPVEIAEILENDARAFEIFKSDHATINMNRFLSLILKGYYDAFTSTYKQMLSQISSLLELNDREDRSDNSFVADMIIKKVFFPEPKRKKGHHLRRLSLKPTGPTMPILVSIENSLNGDSISQFLCRLLTSYTLKPLNERERIVFKSTYDSLRDACESRQPLTFMTTWNTSVIHEVLPYSIEVGKEELYNYLLCQEFNSSTGKFEARSYRLNRIVHEQKSASTIPLKEVVRQYLEMMKHYGAPYPINDDEECCVRLTEMGVQLFNRIYFGRPVFDRKVEKEDGTYYYFKCSKFQLYTYFRRFDKDHAIILYPASLRQQFIDAYEAALGAYASI